MTKATEVVLGLLSVGIFSGILFWAMTNQPDDGPDLVCESEMVFELMGFAHAVGYEEGVEDGSSVCKLPDGPWVPRRKTPGSL